MLSPGVQRKLLGFVEEDAGHGDVTAQGVPEASCKAHIVVQGPAVLGGLEEAVFLFNQFGCKCKTAKKDGDRVKRGEIVLEIEGSNHGLFQVDRTVLNLLGRMSGIATLTDRLRKITGPKIRIAATRKTVPGVGEFDKKAVRLGGGDTHRFHLADMVLLKKTHLSFFENVTEAVRAAIAQASFSKKIEVEVENREQAIKAVEAGADIVMLDNFPPGLAKSTIKKMRALDPRVLIELSGGISEKNLKQFAQAAPDIISLGALTHSSTGVGFSLRIQGKGAWKKRK